MTLGEFRKYTESLPDEIEIKICECPAEYSFDKDDLFYHSSADLLIIDI